MFQDEDEVRSSLRLAVDDLPWTAPVVVPRAPRRTWLPVLASAAAVVAVALVATNLPGPVRRPAARVLEVAFSDLEPAFLSVTDSAFDPPPAGAPLCAAADLRPERLDDRQQGSRRRVRLTLRNVSDRLCEVGGFPDFDLVDANGAAVTFAVDRLGGGRSMGIPPDRLVSTDAEWTAWCRADPGPLRMRLRPPGGGVVTTAAGFGVAACQLDETLARVEGPAGEGRLLLREWSGLHALGSPKSVLDAAIEAPASVRPGERLEFAVVLTNPTDRAVPLADGTVKVLALDGGRGPDCPVYAMRLDVLPDDTSGRTEPGVARPVHPRLAWDSVQRVLDCEAMPEIAPHASVRFRLALAVPSDQPLGTGWLSWDADSYGGFRASDGRPSHDLWVTIEVRR
jgi:hypothetical protein